MITFERVLVEAIVRELHRPKPMMQAVVGPRQTGKSTAVQQAAQRIGWPAHFASADTAMPVGGEWIETHWQAAEMKSREIKGPVFLILDEIQKVRGWPETIKRLWDTSVRESSQVRVALVGSSAWLLQMGLSESLTGRFFLHRCSHWSWPECRDAFGWTLDQWLYFGGYPGAASYAHDETAWKRYVADSLIEPAIARDVLQMQTVHKPALLRHLFALAATFPSQIFSYNKMLGQLHDAGNTTTLAHYLKLMETAFLVSGLELWSGGRVRHRGSSPKLIVWNNALINALSHKSFAEARADSAWWGRLVENAVGAHWLNNCTRPDQTLTYWHDGRLEVDFVASTGPDILALEVKSGRNKGNIQGLSAFREHYPKARTMLIGSEGLALEDFFSTSPDLISPIK